VKLPEEYYFGITASSAENPDSFEVHKFLVSTTNAYTREEPVRNRQPPPNSHDQQKSNQQQRQHGRSSSDHNIPQMLEDVFAATIQSQQDQFADLHNRIQIISHRVDAMFDMLEKYVNSQDERHNHMMGRMVPMHDQISAVQRNVEKVERTTMETLRDIESKDFKDMLRQVHESIERSHDSLGSSIPLTMATSKFPSLPLDDKQLLTFVQSWARKSPA
jgi:mannose-binding lectin 1